MRIEGRAWVCSTPTVYSAPATNASANTKGSTARASAYAWVNSAAVLTLVMPTLDPCEAGLTIIGRPMRFSAGSRSAALDNTA